MPKFPVDIPIAKVIKTLEKLSIENQDRDLFQEFLKTYHNLVETFIEKSNNWEFNTEETSLSGQPFGKNAKKIFSKSQVMTGFGSAVGKVIEWGQLDTINDVNSLIEIVDFEGNDTLDNMIKKLDEIRIIAKKIGNDQRMFFHFLFRELFDRKGDAYLKLNQALDEAYSIYLRKTVI